MNSHICLEDQNRHSRAMVTGCMESSKKLLTTRHREAEMG